MPVFLPSPSLLAYDIESKNDTSGKIIGLKL